MATVHALSGGRAIFGIGRGDGAMHLIGQEPMPLTTSHRVIVRRAPVTFGLVKVPGRSYYQTLRDKLRWGTPPGYRGEP